jgi:ABC-type amino acid transport substrate-binding protein
MFCSRLYLIITLAAFFAVENNNIWALDGENANSEEVKVLAKKNNEPAITSNSEKEVPQSSQLPSSKPVLNENYVEAVPAKIKPEAATAAPIAASPEVAPAEISSSLPLVEAPAKNVPIEVSSELPKESSSTPSATADIAPISPVEVKENNVENTASNQPAQAASIPINNGSNQQVLSNIAVPADTDKVAPVAADTGKVAPVDTGKVAPVAANTDKVASVPADTDKVAPVQLPNFKLETSLEVKEIIDRGELYVSICPVDQPPFHVKNSKGEFEGFDIDLACDIAKTLGVKVKFIEGVDWDSAVEMVVQGKADMVISNLSLTPERSLKVLCSRPYAKIRLCLLLNSVLVARAKSEGFITLRQIFDNYSGNTLLIQEGTAFVDWTASTFPKAKVKTTDSWKEIIDKILTKQVFGTISDELEIRQRLKENQTMELMPVYLKGKYDRIIVGISNRQPQLLHFVNAYLESHDIQCNVEEESNNDQTQH